MATIARMINVNYDVLEAERKRRILNSINIEFEEKKIYTISGPSGSGKTTLLNAVAGLLDSVKGQILIDGINILDKSDKFRDEFRLYNMGIVFQKYNLFSFMNVEENILLPFYLRNERISTELKHKVSEYLAMLQLGQIQKKQISALSGGEQQRIAIIRAIISSPHVILCDEPTACLDSENTSLFMKAMRVMKNQTNGTIIIVTHDPRVYEYGDVRLEMKDGVLNKGV